MLMEPDWRRIDQCRQAGIPEPIFDWLADRGSLTQRLRDTCDGRFRVSVISQENGRPYISEARLLKMREGALSLLREVQLMCEEVPWVFARTVIPVSSLRGPARRLATLGNRPLGQLLFTDPGARRGFTQVARLQPRHALYRVAMAESGSENVDLWARRTHYLLAGQPLLVNEVFLPSLPV